MALSVHHQVSIAEVVVYTPFLAVGVWLALRHGFGRNAGWLYLVLFSLIRILGAALDLATISQTTHAGLYVGSATLQSIGLSALILVLLGLIGRALASISQSRGGGNTLVTAKHLRLVQTLVIVGMILGVVGGVIAGNSFSETGTLQNNSESQAGLGLMVAVFCILTIATVIIGGQVQSAEAGERRLVAAVAASLPFLLVRLVYSCLGTFANDRRFKPTTGDPYIQVGMSVIMEIAVVLICEVTGATLRKIPRGTRAAGAEYEMKHGNGHREHAHGSA